MTETEQELLRLILLEMSRVRNLSAYREHGGDVGEWLARSTAIKDLRTGLGVRVQGGWLGHDAAGRQARKRGLVALERIGLVELKAGWGRNITHVLPTAAAIKLAGTFGITIPPPPQPPPRPQIEHRPSESELRHAKLVAWSDECKAKEAAKREAEHEVDSDADKAESLTTSTAVVG